MNTYKYTGSAPVSIIGVGIVQQNEVIRTDKMIKHPLFKVVTIETRKIKHKLEIKSK